MYIPRGHTYIYRILNLIFQKSENFATYFFAQDFVRQVFCMILHVPKFRAANPNLFRLRPIYAEKVPFEFDS